MPPACWQACSNAATSSGDGGRPIRSKLTRRINVLGSAAGLKPRPCSASCRSRKASIGPATLRSAGRSGTAGWVTGRKAQWSAPLAGFASPRGSSDSGRVFSSSGQAAPAAIQALIVACSAAVSGSPSAGIRSSASSLMMRANSSLAAGSPGTMPTAPESPPAKARPRSSMRKPLSGSSGPWQLPHLAASNGATVDSNAAGSALLVMPHARQHPTAVTITASV